MIRLSARNSGSTDDKFLRNYSILKQTVVKSNRATSNRQWQNQIFEICDLFNYSGANHKHQRIQKYSLIPTKHAGSPMQNVAHVKTTHARHQSKRPSYV